MTQSPINPFLTRYPGPYAYRPGIEGVDLTFDIYCRTTEKLIIAARYWDAEEDAKFIASVVTLALELTRRSDFNAPISYSLQRNLELFREEYPGPYVVSEFLHNDDFSEIGIATREDDDMIVCTQAIPGDSSLTDEAVYIAHAMNQLFEARAM